MEDPMFATKSRPNSNPFAGVAILAAVALAAGCMEADPVTPDPGFAPGASAAVQGMQAGNAAMHQTSGVYTWPPDEAELVEGARATLTRNDRGITLRWHSTVEEPGAYTLWWVIWNDPSLCDGPCGLADLGVDGVSVMSAGGFVVGKSGRANFGSRLNVGEITAAHAVLDDPAGLENPRDAEVHVVLRSHGPMVPEYMPEQIETFEGGCTPGSSFGAGDGPNECEDVQFTLFR